MVNNDGPTLVYQLKQVFQAGGAVDGGEGFDMGGVMWELPGQFYYKFKTALKNSLWEREREKTGENTV